MIKQEHRDERVQIDSKPAAIQQKSITPITFSITNILSNNFGNVKTPSTKMCVNDNNNKIIGEKRGSILFRPYDNHTDDDDEDDENESASPKPVKIRRRQQSDDEESNGRLINFMFMFIVALQQLYPLGVFA